MQEMEKEGRQYKREYDAPGLALSVQQTVREQHQKEIDDEGQGARMGMDSQRPGLQHRLPAQPGEEGRDQVCQSQRSCDDCDACTDEELRSMGVPHFGTRRFHLLSPSAPAS